MDGKLLVVDEKYSERRNQQTEEELQVDVAIWMQHLEWLDVSIER